MSLLSRLFGGSKNNAPDPVSYNGYVIFADPVEEAGGFRLSARIEKEFGGELKVHNLIRADVPSNRDEAVNLSIAKAKQVIDQQGDAIFR